MVSRALAFVAVVGMGFLLFPLLTGVEPQQELTAVAREYVERTPSALGAANMVTAVIVTYRGLDTLGEVTVLFLATAGVGFLLRRTRGDGLAGAHQIATGRIGGSGGVTPLRPDTLEDIEHRERTGQATARGEGEPGGHPPSEILRTGSRLLFPVIVVFGVYIFAHGHLTPGGGFQGGVVIAAAALLFMLAGDAEKIRHGLLSFLEAGTGSLYVLVGILGLAFAGGFLDSRLLPLGEFGALISAGTIPVVYSLIGLKVGAELTGILQRLSDDPVIPGQPATGAERGQS